MNRCYRCEVTENFGIRKIFFAKYLRASKNAPKSRDVCTAVCVKPNRSAQKFTPQYIFSVGNTPILPYYITYAREASNNYVKGGA